MSIFFRDVMLRTTGYAFKIFIDVLENILIHVPASIKASKDQVRRLLRSTMGEGGAESNSVEQGQWRGKPI